MLERDGLTDLQKCTYDRDGWVFIDSLFTQEECEGLMQHMEAVHSGEIKLAGFVPPDEDMEHLIDIDQCHIQDRVCQEFMLHPKLRQPLRDVLNGDEPEAVVYASRIATDFRLKFNRDVVIDLICYRRFGHNEGDEPSFTQPLMYKKIRSHPSPVKVNGEKLINENKISTEYLNSSIKKFKELLDNQYKNAKDYKPKIEWFEGTWSRYRPERGKDKRGVTGSDTKKLKDISNKINTIPSEVNIHKTISKILDNRKLVVAKGKGIDWSTAEALAFGSLLEEGYPVRLVGQDSGRGTFSQRHSVLRNQIDNSRYIPVSYTHLTLPTNREV